MTEKMIIDAYCRIRTIDQTIPDDVLDFMKNAAIEKLRKNAVIKSVCKCKNSSWNRDAGCFVCDDCGERI
jgi:hypothetical protein